MSSSWKSAKPIFPRIFIDLKPSRQNNVNKQDGDVNKHYGDQNKMKIMKYKMNSNIHMNLNSHFVFIISSCYLKNLTKG